MTRPIDRIANVRASVDDVERQMQACQAAGVQFPPTFAWRLLAECRGLLGPTLDSEKARSLREAADEWEELVRQEKPPVRGSVWLHARADRLEGLLASRRAPDSARQDPDLYDDALHAAAEEHERWASHGKASMRAAFRAAGVAPDSVVLPKVQRPEQGGA